MSIIIRLQNLPWSASSVDIRTFFSGLSIPVGGVHIVGGELGEAFIVFSTDEDARLAMERNGGSIKDMKIKLLLSSRNEMARVIEQARTQSSQVLPPNIPVAMKAAAINDSDRRPTEERVPTSLIRDKKVISMKEYERSRSRSPALDRSIHQYDHPKHDVRRTDDLRVRRDETYGNIVRNARDDELLRKRKYMIAREAPKSVEIDPNINMHPRVGLTPGLSYGAKQSDGGGSVPQDYGRGPSQRVSEAPYLFPAAMHSASLKTDAKTIVDQSRLPTSFVTSNATRTYDNVVSSMHERPSPIPAALTADVGPVAAPPRDRKQHPNQYAPLSDSIVYSRMYDSSASRDTQNVRGIVPQAQRGPGSSQYRHESDQANRSHMDVYPENSARPASEEHKTRYYDDTPTSNNSRPGVRVRPAPPQPQLTGRYSTARQSRFHPEHETTEYEHTDNDAYYSTGDNTYESANAYPEDPEFDDTRGYADDAQRNVPRRPMRDRFEADEALWPPVSASPSWDDSRRDYPDHSRGKNELVEDYGPEPMDIEDDDELLPPTRHPIPGRSEGRNVFSRPRPESPLNYRDPYNKNRNSESSADIYDRYQARNRGEPQTNDRRPSQRATELQSHNFPLRKRGYENQNEDLSDRPLVKSSRKPLMDEPLRGSRSRTRNFPLTRWGGPARDSPGSPDRSPRNVEPSERRTSSSAQSAPPQYPLRSRTSDSVAPRTRMQNRTSDGHTANEHRYGGSDSRHCDRTDQYKRENTNVQKPEHSDTAPSRARREQASHTGNEQRRDVARKMESQTPPASQRREAPISKPLEKSTSQLQGVTTSASQNRELPRLTVQVRGLPKDASEADVVELFRDISIPTGNIRLMNGDKGQPNSTAFVKFKDQRGYEQSLQRDGKKIRSCSLEVKPCPLSAFENCKQTSKEKTPSSHNGESSSPFPTSSSSLSLKEMNVDEAKKESEIQSPTKPSVSQADQQKKQPPRTQDKNAESSSKSADSSTTSGRAASTPAERNRRPPPNPGRQPSSETDLCIELKGLPYTCKKQDVTDFFSSLRILDMFIEKLPDGRASGLGYVEFATPADFQAALEANGKKISYRYIAVSAASRELMNRARHKKKPALLETPPVVPNRRNESPLEGRSAAPNDHHFCAAIDGVPKEATNYDLEAFFADVNVVPIAIHVMKGPDKYPSGKAFLELQGPAELDASISKNGQFMFDKRISVRPISYNQMCDILGGRPNTVLPNFSANVGPSLSQAKSSRRVLMPSPKLDNVDMPRDHIPPSPVNQSVPPAEILHRPEGPRGPPHRPPFANRMRGPPPPGGPLQFPPRPFGPRESGARPHRFIRPPGPLPPPPNDPTEPGDFGMPGCVVAVSNLHFRASLEDILSFFGNYMLEHDSVIRKYTNAGQPTGDARISFHSPQDAMSAVNELNMQPIFGRPVYLSIL